MNKILEKFKEGMLSEDISYNSIRNYISDIRNFYKWYQEIDFSEDLNKMTIEQLVEETSTGAGYTLDEFMENHG